MVINPTNFLIHYFTEDLDIIEEKQEVSSTNQIQLQYIPSNTIAMTVTYNGAEMTNYTVDYNTGVVTFGDILTNKNVLATYTAIGEWSISASKVYTNYDNRNDILETLEDLINKQNAIIEQIKVIGDVATIITAMQNNIDNLRELYDIVLNNEAILDNIKTTIEQCVADSNAIILATNTAIANATVSKNNLDASISTANTTKTTLENTTTTCTNTINNLVTTKQTEMTTFTTTKQGELTSTSATCVSNVNTAIGSANTKITEMNQWVVDNGDLIDLNDRVDVVETDKQNKTDATLNTTDKTIVGGINELLANSLLGVYSDSGYKSFKTSTGNFLMQWGSGVVNNSSYEVITTVTFPKAMNTPFYPVVSLHDMNGQSVVSTKNLTKTGFDVVIRAVAPASGGVVGVGAIRFNYQVCGIE